MTEPTRPTQREYWNSRVGDEWARQGDLMDRMLEPLTQPAFDLLDLQPNERVLDIGCGAGATTLKAAEYVRGGIAVGVDISQPLLALAQQRASKAGGIAVGVDISQPLLALAQQRASKAGGNARFLEADVATTKIVGAPYDAAFSRFGVMFFDDPAHGFAKIREALEPGGRIVFICWRPFAENGWSYAPLAALKSILKEPLVPADPNSPGPFQLQDPEKIKAILAGAGWRDVSITPWDGDVLVGGGGDASTAAAFLLKIGPCARAIAEQQLDAAEAERLLTDFLRKHETPEGVPLAAACWIVRAVA